MLMAGMFRPQRKTGSGSRRNAPRSYAVFVVLAVVTLPAACFAINSSSPHLATSILSKEHSETSRLEGSQVLIEGIESLRAPGVPREEKVQDGAFRPRQANLAPPLHFRSKSVLRGASKHPDHGAIGEDMHNQRMGGMRGDDDDLTSAVHNGARNKDSRPTSTPHGIHKLGSALVSFVAVALLSSLSTIGSFTADNGGADGGAHDESSFDEDLGVDPGAIGSDTEVGDEYVTEEDNWKAAVMVVGDDDVTGIDLFTSSWASSKNVDSASGPADRAVVTEQNGLDRSVSRARMDLRTSHTSADERERMTNRLDLPPLPGNVETIGLVPSKYQKPKKHKRG